MRFKIHPLLSLSLPTYPHELLSYLAFKKAQLVRFPSACKKIAHAGLGLWLFCFTSGPKDTMVALGCIGNDKDMYLRGRHEM